MKYTLLVCGLMVAMGAMAQPGSPKLVALDLQSLDIDGDKMISLAEAEQGAPRLASRFTELDANHDGLLSSEEVGKGRAGAVRVVRHFADDFAEADSNADGMLSKDEAKQMPVVADFFAEMDASADGYVTMEEIDAHAKAHGPVLKHVKFERRLGTEEE